MSAQQLSKMRWLLSNRLPLLGGWLRRRAARTLAQDGTPEAVQILAKTLADGGDTDVCALARQALDGLTQQECIDTLGKTWVETRSPALAELLTAHQWTVSRPVAVRVLCAILTGQEESVANGEAAVVAPLLVAAAEPDTRIAEGAQRVLRALRRTTAQEAVCRAFLEQSDSHARDAALAADYQPREAPQRALFFFLTKQWQRYEGLDFDCRLLGTLYAAATPELRARILATLRASGRSDYLPVLTGSDAASRAATLNTAEAAVLVGSLSTNQEWEKLWPLAFSLPFSESVHILRILTGAGWQPKEEEERAFFRELAERMPHAPETLAALLPPAVQRARLRVAARINDVAFAPGRTELAIGTGRCSVVRWDYQRAAITETLTGLEHSVGRLAYTGNGMLLCGERTNQPDTPCAVYGWENGERFLLEQRTGSITALEAYAETQMLIAGRDGGVSLWDTKKRAKINARQLPDWPRAACVAPDGQRAALLHQGVTLVPLPSLQDPAETEPAGEMDVGIIRSDPYPAHQAISSGTGVVNCAAFTAGGEELILGKHTGEVRLGTAPKEPTRRARQALVRHKAAVKGIEIVPGQNTVISAAADGCVQFTDWKERRVLGKITLPGVPLTALHLSPDGASLALGAADASLSLWDLRPLAVQTLCTEPLARAVPAHLTAIGILLEDTTLPEEARQGLEYLACVLRHRFRYAIEVDTGPVIRLGEFDIEIEG